MLMQTNSYVVPRDKQEEHARLVKRIRQIMSRLGCDMFDVFEQTGASWSNSEATGRFVQIMRFRDRRHQLAVQTAEREDRAAQEVIKEFCDLVNLPQQQQQGLFSVGFYNSVLSQSDEGSGQS
ncbi:MAG TPA: hypothetical protein VG722_05955 [Tepidisphaeraceae bacterium]|nr:hypothetical protein [Tepidisphaeraceae bacterium]